MRNNVRLLIRFRTGVLHMILKGLKNWARGRIIGFCHMRSTYFIAENYSRGWKEVSLMEFQKFRNHFLVSKILNDLLPPYEHSSLGYLSSDNWYRITWSVHHKNRSENSSLVQVISILGKTHDDECFSGECCTTDRSLTTFRLSPR